MKITLLLFTVLFFCSAALPAQGVFQSSASGNWNDPASWALVSGTSTSNYPVAGDSATITGAATITVTASAQCQSLTINGAGILQLNSGSSLLAISNALTVTAASKITIDMGSLTVSGQATLNAASTITINQGLMTVLGVMLVNCPTTAAGTTLLDIEGGVFSCAGGMSITATTVPANRFAEMRIGSSAVNIVGGLASITANAKINFTAGGALTLAGVISIASGGFTAGNGTVIYFGIPGSDQLLAPLTYNRLVITGLGSGVKKINGTVTVTDTLTLLTDTLVVNSGAVLNIANGAAIVRTGGVLATTPVFAGIADLVYNDVTRDTTGAEMPVAAGVLRNLTINDVAGIKLGANATVSNMVNFQNGPLLTDVYSFTIVNPYGGVLSDTAVQRTNGYVIGTINRGIGTSTGIRTFPFGISQAGYRECSLNYTAAPTSAGVLTVQYFDTSAAAQSGFPLIDGSITITKTLPVYWQADAGGGLSGGVYTLSLTAQAIGGVADYSSLRIVKRPSTGGPWILDGAAAANTGTNNAPVVLRSGMSGFSQFSIGGNNSNVLPVSLLYFSGQVSGRDVLLNWAATNEMNNNFYSIEYSKNGLDFTPIGRVSAANPSAQQNNYSFTHYSAPAGMDYYRLVQTDIDGKYTYSNILSLRVSGLNNFKVYPVLASASITIEPPGASDLRLFNSNGQYIKNVYAGINDISSLSKGMYYIRYQGGVAKFIKE